VDDGGVNSDSMKDETRKSRVCLAVTVRGSMTHPEGTAQLKRNMVLRYCRHYSERKTHMKIRIVLFAFCLVMVGISSCGKKTAQSEATVIGKDLFVSNECTLCHGAEGIGKSAAPALRGLMQYWTKDELVKYFQDPAGVAKNIPRLAARRGNYPRMMPSFSDQPKSDLEKLAEYVLSLN
jgi:mono/diheme cytochrome c family protein